MPTTVKQTASWLDIDLLDIEIHIDSDLNIEAECLCRLDKTKIYDKLTKDQAIDIRDWLTGVIRKHGGE